MPRDEHQRNRDRDHQRRANQELATFGQLRSYEHAYDCGAAPRGEAISLVDFLNLLRKKATTQLQERIPRFKNMPESGDTTSIPLLAYGLEAPDALDFISLAEFVEHIGPRAVKELCHLMLLSNRTRRSNILMVLNRIKKTLCNVVVVELEVVLKSGQPERRKAALALFNQLDWIDLKSMPADVQLIAFLNRLRNQGKPNVQKDIPCFMDVPVANDHNAMRLLQLGLKTTEDDDIRLLRLLVTRIGPFAAKTMCFHASRNQNQTARLNAGRVIQNLGPELDKLVLAEMARLSALRPPLEPNSKIESQAKKEPKKRQPKTLGHLLLGKWGRLRHPSLVFSADGFFFHGNSTVRKLQFRITNETEIEILASENVVERWTVVCIDYEKLILRGNDGSVRKYYRIKTAAIRLRRETRLARTKKGEASKPKE